MDEANNNQQIEDEGVSWQASEYIHHEKDFFWFGVFILLSVLVMAGMYLLLEDILSIAVIALMVISLIIFANRKPRTLDYTVNDYGVAIGDRKYSYDSFRSFSVTHNAGIDSILLDPLQRFMPPITIYFAPDDGQQIVDLLSAFLPHRDHKPDWVDQLAQRFRF